MARLSSQVLSTLIISSLSHEASTFVYNLMAMTYRVVQSVCVGETVVHLVTSLWELSVNTFSKSSFSTKTRIARFFWRHDANRLWKVVQFAQFPFLICSLKVALNQQHGNKILSAVVIQYLLTILRLACYCSTVLSAWSVNSQQLLVVQLLVVHTRTECHHHHHATTVLLSFFRDHPGEPVPEENFWTLWCKRKLTEPDTPAIRLGTTTSGVISAHIHHRPHSFLHAGCPSCRPTNSVKALKATNAFGLGRRR